MSPRKPRRGVKNSGRWWSEAKPLLRIQWVKKCRRPDRKSVTPSGFFISSRLVLQGFFLRDATKASPSSPSVASLHHLPVFCRTFSALWDYLIYHPHVFDHSKHCSRAAISMLPCLQSIAFMLPSQCSRVFRALLP